ncbi:MAG: hypothetical protein A2V70_07940 [Planctomycetes bacterium RBG_13_63_9]|nr:MAG: hypothetical protein A2V70_07940 [Planctomycetes bacterium RBG_13_63_9]
MARQATITRRKWLRHAGGAAGALVAAPYLITSSALGADDRPPASERITMGGIGIGQMGSGDLGAFLGRGDVQYLAACDAKKGVCEGAKGRVDKHYGNNDCQAYADFRELLARDDIDAVHVATPDHWHAVLVIDACRHGKDVYCQKPETLTLSQGPAMVEAARKYGRVVSGGSQRVLEDYRGAVDPCWGGELGTIKSINVNVSPLSLPCNLPPEPVPEGFDWDMWLGPAPWAPYHPYRCSGSFAIDGTSWRSWKDYSGGGMTDWGAHHFGGATFAVDVRELEPEEVVYHDDKDGKYLSYRYPNGLLLYHNHPGMGNLHVVGTPGEKRTPKPVPTYKGRGGIYGDFIHCVKTRERPFRDIEIASHTMAVCHLGLIAYELQRPLKWDQAKQVFPGDEEANRLSWRPMREPWRL